MKTLFTIFIFTLALVNAVAQNCASPSLTPNESDICWVQRYLDNSPINSKLEPSDFKYNTGLNDYYQTGKYVPWGGYYMPFSQGGIATRWRTTPLQIPKSNNLFTWEQIQSMTKDQIAKLSPAEKMDIYLGNTDFRITKRELQSRGPEKPGVESWEGFCNGNRLAGTMLPEPDRVIIVKSKNLDKDVFVTFYPADLKALANASYFHAEWYAQIGEQNKRKPDAGNFDIILRGVLGKQHRTFFVDIHPSARKFNESVIGYKRKILREQLAGQDIGLPANTNKILTINTILYVLGEVPIEAMNTSTKPRIQNKEFVKEFETQYRLFVNADNTIIKGEWINNSSGQLKYPDSVWLASGVGTDNWIQFKDSGGNTDLPFFEVQNLFLLASQF